MTMAKVLAVSALVLAPAHGILMSAPRKSDALPWLDAPAEPWFVEMVGDCGFDPLGLKPTDPKEFAEMQTKELNNGR